jgi:hypothetical protein
LLSLFFGQDVTHIAEGKRPRVGINVLVYGLSLAGFEVIIDGRFWVITEVLQACGQSETHEKSDAISNQLSLLDL